jgi:hypothetical protein
MKKLFLLALLTPSLALASNWQCVNHNPIITCNTWRMPVPHGWLVSTDNGDEDIAMTFVPDEQHDWKL